MNEKNAQYQYQKYLFELNLNLKCFDERKLVPEYQLKLIYLHTPKNDTIKSILE